MTDIVALSEVHVPSLAELHARVLPQTLNSRLGAPFLSNLYRTLLADPDARCWVATQDSNVLGFVSATKDLHATEHRIMSNLSLKNRLIAAFHLLTHFSSLKDFLSHKALSRACRRFGRPYPTLLTIGVAPTVRGVLAYQLIGEGHKFFKEAGCPRYFTDILVENERAQTFYEQLGFEKQLVVAGNVVRCRQAQS